jgi:type VI secretion system secreted protein VgrG
MPEDSLLLCRFEWKEELGRPFRGVAVMRSASHEIAASQVLGQTAAIRVNAPDGSVRWFHGYIAEFEQTEAMRGGLAGYEALIVPWTWFLARTEDCRIFQEESAAGIISRVFKDSPTASSSQKLVRRYLPYEYKVQYRESDHAFIHRLLEHEGMFYSFAHTQEQHTLLLLDDNAVAAREHPQVSLRFVPGSESKSDPRALHQWRHRGHVRTGRFHSTDFNFKEPETSLLAKAERSKVHQLSDAEVFEFPGKYDGHAAGDAYVRTRLEELVCRQDVYVGMTACRGVRAGSGITVSEHPRRDQNRDYLATRVEIAADAGGFEGSEEGQDGFVFTCRFECIPSSTPFRLERKTPQPQIRGPQTAVVTGPAGQEIHTDEFGRVKLQFHWDRYGRNDEHSSCWVRVSQPWAGKGWGGVQIPRIGQEVIVECLEADPDRPIITGRVYNAGSMPPVSGAGRDPAKGEANPLNMMEAAMQMTMRSQSLGGSGGHNEITMHDAGGAEKLFIRAQKDEVHLVQNDRTRTVGNNESVDIGVNETRKVGTNQNVTVGENIVIEAGTSITLKCGAASIHMNQAGFITISGSVISVVGTVNTSMTAPITNVTGAVLLTMAGAANLSFGAVCRTTASNLLSLNSSGQGELVASGDAVVQGKQVKLN